MSVNSVGKFSTNIVKKAVTQLGKPGALLPVAVLEVTVDSGRGYNAKKRGGFTEMRERIIDDVSAGIFWLFGAVGLYKLGDWLGKKLLKLKNPGFSLGVDKARNSIKQAQAANPNFSKTGLTVFKSLKVFGSIAAAIAFIGWGLPKINQTLSRKLKNKNKETQNVQPSSTNVNSKNKNDDVIKNAKKLFDDFNNYVKQKKSSSKPSFGLKLADTLGVITHNVENNNVWRLGTTDGGILVGRTTNALKRDPSGSESIEYAFRDGASSYFYLWAMPHTIWLCNKLDPFKGKNTGIDPSSAVRVNKYLANIIGDKKMSVQEFEEIVFGKPDNARLDMVKGAMEKTKNISVEDFIKLTNADETLSKKALKMSRLQPKIDGIAILTDRQVKDVLTNGAITDPSFQYRVVNGYFREGGKKLFGKNKGKVVGYSNIQDKMRYIKIGDIEKLQDNITNYAQSVVQMAKKQASKTGGVPEITMDVLKKTARRNSIMHSSYLALGLGISMLFLSTLIPKMQYWITKKRTGKDGFPGAV